MHAEKCSHSNQSGIFLSLIYWLYAWTNTVELSTGARTWVRALQWVLWSGVWGRAPMPLPIPGIWGFCRRKCLKYDAHIGRWCILTAIKSLVLVLCGYPIISDRFCTKSTGGHGGEWNSIPKPFQWPCPKASMSQGVDVAGLLGGI